MNNGAFGENFPYSNFHDLNMDWLVKIAKDFLDQYSQIQTTLDNGLEALDTKATELEGLLQEWYDTHSEDIADELTNALQAIANELEEATTDFRTRAVDIAADVIETIPADYTELTNFVNESSEGLASFEDTGAIILSRGNFQRNVYNPQQGYVNEYPYRISSRKDFRFPYTPTINIADGFRVYVYRYYNNAWTGTGWRTGSSQLIANERYHFQIARVEEDESETADINFFLKQVTITGSPVQETLSRADDIYIDNTNNFIPLEEGGYSISDGKLVKTSYSDIRMRSKAFFKLPQAIRVNIKQPGVRVVLFVCQEDGTYGNLSESYESTTTPVIGVLNGSAYYSDYYNYNFAVTIIFNNLSETPVNVRDYVDIISLTDNFVLNGKQTLIYRFGGAGNDWCFVRTPEYYNQFRNKPYPFVICNHGNGWTMNGTPEKANWTKRTMYVPLDDPDYIANPSQYNGTADESLWYSNPTIEALLNAGYIVCGCENYGDELYGNNNCRNACADFFNHMINTYNVEKRCYMIGASNGAMTSLNAAHVMPGLIKAMILQYPLTCLVNQYQSNANQQPGIRSAYNISNTSITPTELAKVVCTHDPLTTDVVNGIKADYMPPIMIYYSEQDTVCRYNVNTIPFSEMLDDSNKKVLLVRVTGEHGDASHFDPQAYVTWFNQN